MTVGAQFNGGVMAIDPIDPVNGVRHVESLRKYEKISTGEAPSASAYLSSTHETARAQVNAASTLPHGDGLFTIGNVAVKVVKAMGSFVRSVGSSWGF